MNRTQRIVLLLAVCGIVAGVAIALLPVSQPTAATTQAPAPSNRGGGVYGGTFWGGVFGGDPQQCGPAAPAFFRYSGGCHTVARDRLTVAGVVGGGALVVSFAGAWLLSDARERTAMRPAGDAELRPPRRHLVTWRMTR